MLSASADHVAAFVLEPLAVDRTRVECALLFDPDAVAAPTFDPSDAADLWDLVNRQDWAVCESVQRGMSSRGYTTAGSRRWRTTASTSAGGCCPGWSGGAADGSERAGRLRRRRARRAGQRRPPGSWPGAATRSSGWSGSGSATAAAPATTPAGSCGTATTPRRYVELTQEAYDDWARLEAAIAASSSVTVVGGLDLFPPGAGDPARRLRSLARPRAASTSRCSTLTESPVGGRSSGCRRARWGCTRQTRPIVPAGGAPR